MSARQNPHARQNRGAVTVAMALQDQATVDREGSDASALDADAHRHLACVDTNAPPVGLRGQMQSHLKKLVAKNLDRLQLWLASENPQLRLVATLWHIHFGPRRDAPTLGDLRDRCADIFATSADPRLQTLAAIGLSDLYINRRGWLVPGEAPEILVLAQGLASQDTRAAALSALRYQFVHSHHDAWLNSEAIQDGLRTALSDPATSVSDRIFVLSVSRRAGIVSADELVRRVLDSLRLPILTPSELEALLRCLHTERASNLLAGVLAETSVDRRLAILGFLDTTGPSHLHWPNWRSLVFNKAQDPQVLLRLLTLFASRAHDDVGISLDYLRLAGCKNLSREVRGILCHVLWLQARRIEKARTEPAVIDALLDLLEDPAVLDVGFPPASTSTPIYEGCMSTASLARILDRLNDRSLSNRLRFALARSVPVEQPVPTEGTRLLLDAYLDEWVTVTSKGGKDLLLRGTIIDRVKFDSKLAQAAFDDERTPVNLKLDLLPYVPRAAVMRYAKSPSFEVRNQDAIIGALCRGLPMDFDKAVRAASNKGPEFLQQILSTPNLCSDNPDDHFAVSRDSSMPEILRWIAAEWSVSVQGRNPTARVLDATESLSAFAVALTVHPTEDLIAALIAHLRGQEIKGPDLRWFTGFLMVHREDVLAEIMSRPDLPAKRLRELATCLTSNFRSRPCPMAWETWRSVLAKTDNEALGTCLIDVFFTRTTQAAWPVLVDMVGQQDRPFAIRKHLFRQIWEHARMIDTEAPESIGRPVLARLLDVADVADLAVVAFEDDRPKNYQGWTDDPEVVNRIQEQLRDSALPEKYRWLIAECAPPKVPMPTEGRRRIVDNLIAKLNSANFDVTFGDTLWLRVLEHTERDHDLARGLIAEGSLPASHLAYILSHLPRQDFFRFASDLYADPEARETIEVCLHYLVPRSHSRSMIGMLAADSPEWRELCAIPAFTSPNSLDLIDVLATEGYSSTARELAFHWLENDIVRNEEFREPTLRAILQQFASRDLRDPDANVLAVIITHALARSANDELPRIVASALADRGVPTARHRDLLRRLPSFLFNSHPALFWEAVVSRDEPESRADLIRQFRDGGFVTKSPDLETIIRRLSDRESPEAIALSEQTWDQIKRLGEAASRDLVGLVKLAREDTISPVVRATAIRRIAGATRPQGELRQLWRYLGTVEGRALWDGVDDNASDDAPSVSRAIAKLLSQNIDNEGLRTVLKHGPKHYLWDSLIHFVQLPEQSLVSQALENITAPTNTSWERLQNAGPAIPPEARLLVCTLFHRRSNVEDGMQILNDAFSLVRDRHTRRAALTEVLARAVASSQQTRSGIASALTRARLSRPEEVDDLVRALQFARVELQSYPESHDPFPLTDPCRALIRKLPVKAPPKELAGRFQTAIASRLLPALPDLSADHFTRAIEETEAPAVLAAHYKNVHLEGLPLLARAVEAHAQGKDAWVAWRFFRTEARQQLGGLADAEVTSWSQDLGMPIGVDTVPEDIRDVAARIRTELSLAVKSADFPAAYARLLAGLFEGSTTPATRITAYQGLQRILGRRIAGENVAPDPALVSHLPEEEREELGMLLRKDPAGTGGGQTRSDETQQQLLAWRHRLSRAVDLIRLLYCDAHALARNDFRAVGESDGQPAVSAVAYFKQLRRAFQQPETRQQRVDTGKRATGALNDALETVWTELQKIKTFTTAKELVAREASDFPTLIEIGHRPYGQGSCQNYASRDSMNCALLGYVADAMTKAIVIATPPSPDNPRGTLLARAIVRLGFTTDTDAKRPVLVMEKTYAPGGEGGTYTPLLRTAVRDFARRRGWRAGIPDESTGSVSDCQVRIAASQNGIQYEDAALAIIGTGASRSSLQKKEYVLRVTYLPDSG